MTDTEATLLAAIIGGIIGIVGTYIGAVRIADRQRLIDAGRRLREAFQDELATLKAPGEVNASDLLESAFKKHLIAITEFAHVIQKCKRIAYDQAWKDYHCYPEPPFIHLLEQYDTVTGSMEQRNKNRVLAIKRIEHIISFANK